MESSSLAFFDASGWCDSCFIFHHICFKKCPFHDRGIMSPRDIPYIHICLVNTCTKSPQKSNPRLFWYPISLRITCTKSSNRPNFSGSVVLRSPSVPATDDSTRSSAERRSTDRGFCCCYANSLTLDPSWSWSHEAPGSRKNMWQL